MMDEKPSRWLVSKENGFIWDVCSDCGARFPMGFGADSFHFCPKCGQPKDLGGRVNDADRSQEG